MPRKPDAMRGRGAAENPPNRFTTMFYVGDQDWHEPDDPAPVTQCLRDTSRSIITRNDSPDVGFDTSIGSVSKVEMVAPMAFTYKALFSSISTFETPPAVSCQDHDAICQLRVFPEGSLCVY